MLNKLLKYDLKYMIKNMGLFYILTIFFSITTRLLSLPKQTVLIVVLGKISTGCLIAMMCNILFNTVIRSWVRFRDSIYKDESYLTHTLPVTKTQIYESRFIQTLIYTLVGFVIILLGLFIAYYTKDNWLALKNLLNSISAGLDINTFAFVALFILIFFIEIINTIQSGYLGIILGYRLEDNKLLFSFIFGLVAYSISTAVLILILLILGIFNKDILNIFTTNSIDNEMIKLLVIISITGYTFIVAAMNFICVKIFNKGVNIE